mgnify:CR=1 FL=1
MIPSVGVVFTEQSSIPRESGDDPVFHAGQHVAVPYSPRERG